MKRGLKITLITIGAVIGVLILFSIVAFVRDSLMYATSSDDGGHSYPTAEAPQMASAGLGSRGGDYEMEEAVMMDSDGDYNSAPATKSSSNSANNTIEETNQKVVKTGSLELEVASVGDVITKITDYTTTNEGFVANSKVRSYDDGTKYATVVVRVPAKYFEPAMGEFKLMAKAVEKEDASGQDVTEEYVDLESRLKNMRLEEAQYQEVLKKATKVSDILEVNRYLFSVREDIERIEGSLRYMDNLTDLSTITLQLSEETKLRIPTDDWKPFATLKEAFRGMVVLWQGIVNVLIWVLFLLVPVTLIAWLVYKVVKKIRHRHDFN